MLRLAFGGKAGSGKSTAATIIKKLVPGVVELAFADPLKELVTTIYRATNQIEVEKDRKLLQFLGTDWGRGRDENIWTNMLLWKMIAYAPTQSIVISDVRFKNELQLAKDHLFKTIYIQRDGLQPDWHPSENELNANSGWDHVIVNDENFEETLKCIIYGETTASKALEFPQIF